MKRSNQESYLKAVREFNEVPEPKEPDPPPASVEDKIILKLLTLKDTLQEEEDDASTYGASRFIPAVDEILDLFGRLKLRIQQLELLASQAHVTPAAEPQREKRQSCRHCGLRIYLDGNTWRHHGSNFVECYGGRESHAEPSELPAEPQPLSVEEARAKGVCRICGQGPDADCQRVGFVTEYLDKPEHAHIRCLPRITREEVIARLDRERAGKDVERFDEMETVSEKRFQQIRRGQGLPCSFREARAIAYRLEQAERELAAAQASGEQMLWNLAGCCTLAESRRLTEYAKDKALPALDAVAALLRDYLAAQADFANLSEKVAKLPKYVPFAGSNTSNVVVDANLLDACQAAAKPGAGKPCAVCNTYASQMLTDNHCDRCELERLREENEKLDGDVKALMRGVAEGIDDLPMFAELIKDAKQYKKQCQRQAERIALIANAAEAWWNKRPIGGGDMFIGDCADLMRIIRTQAESLLRPAPAASSGQAGEER